MKKGKLRTVVGDVTNPQISSPYEISVISHVCNNENKFGAGFVLALSKKWAQPEKVYREFCEKNKGLPILGKVCYAKIGNLFIIANMIAQDGTVSENNPKPIKYRALANCMAEVTDYINMIKTQRSNPVVIHAPKFGSGLAQATWEFVLELIEELWINEGLDVVIYNFENEE
jgi:O-acetyl-ADP-ribose deacetylase (regulator of RNase III)